MSKAKPRPYSYTDIAEHEALLTLQELVDRRFVKDEIRTGDKVSNVDGTIELVDEQQVPYGKLEVQLRKIPEGARKYSCPSSLVGYSQVSTLPVLLICADTANRKAYWKHVSPTMPGYKEEQDSFTIYFDEAGDGIGLEGVYLHKWSEIVCEYQKRINDYLALRQKVDRKLKLTGLSHSDKIAFQRFIDTVNNLLEQEFICIRGPLFPGAWKLGVAVSASEPDSVLYQVYEIRYGQPTPLVCEAEGTLFGREWKSIDIFYETIIERERLSDPEALGRAFVLKYVQRGVKKRVLSIHGTLLASEVLIRFVDRYPSLLGLTPGKDSYRLSELSHALNDHMYGICAALARDKKKRGERLPVLKVDEVSSWLRTHPVQPVPPGEASVPFLVRSDRPPMRLVLDAFDYLVAHEVTLVQRVFARRSQSPTRGANWLWSGYSEEDEIGSVTKILSASVEEYSAFVAGNRLRLPSSPYLDETTAIVYEYYPVKYQQRPSSGPEFRVYFLENPDLSLPKVSVRVRTDDGGVIDGSGLPHVMIDGVAYQARRSAGGSADFLFVDMPVLNTVYRMLREDLAQHYQLDEMNLRS